MVNLFFIDLSPYTFSHEEDRFKNHLTGAPVLREHAHVHQRVLLADDVLARGVAKDSEGGVQRSGATGAINKLVKFKNKIHLYVLVNQLQESLEAILKDHGT